MKIILEIKDAEKAKTIVNFLNQNPYIKIKDIENIERKKKNIRYKSDVWIMEKKNYYKRRNQGKSVELLKWFYAIPM